MPGRTVAVSANDAANYLKRYAEAYRSEYDGFTKRPPVGGGYPRLPVSPYLTSPEILCYLTPDGAVVADHSWQPDYEWYIAGGPALMVDFQETRTPPEVTERLRAAGILGKNIGIYRIVGQGGVPEEMWNGNLGEPVETAERSLASTRILVRRFDLDCKTLIQRLTYGALGFIIDFEL